MCHIGEALYKAGHHVHILMSPTFPDMDNVKKGHFKVITHATPDPDYYTMLQKQVDNYFGENYSYPGFPYQCQWIYSTLYECVI